MAENKEHELSSDPLENLTGDQLAELIKTNEALDKQEESLLKEEFQEKKRKELEQKSSNQSFRRLRRSPIEIVNRCLLLIFLGSFLFSFFSVYISNRWWFFWYLISAFSCILYTPNRKTIKELIAAWPNLEDIMKKRSYWKRKPSRDI